MPIAATTARKAPIAAVLCSALLGAVLLAGCGSSSASLSRGEASRLDGHIEALRVAAAANDAAGARDQLDDLVGDISALRRASRLSPSQARTLTADLAQLRATVAAMLAPSSGG